MCVAEVSLALALLPLASQIQVRPSDLPLVIPKAEYTADQSFVEFSVRNDGTVPIIAWSVGMTWRYLEGPESSGSFSVDAYEQAAGVPTAPRNNRVLAPGDTAEQRIHAVTRLDGTRPYLLELQARAVVLAGNEGLGDPRSIQSIFLQRNQSGKAWTDIVSMLRAARAAASDTERAYSDTVAALKSLEAERTLQGIFGRSLLYRLRNSERDGMDRALVLEELLQDARQHADAAERFGTPSAKK